MSHESRTQSQQTMVEVDADRCTLCEFCAKSCPTDAIRVEKTATELRLYFTPSSCSGCSQKESCETLCPEEAIRLTTAEAGAEIPAPLLLARGDLVSCSNCKETFAPLRKIEALADKGQTSHAIIADLCPVCRRKHLVVDFIEQRRAPGSKAEYRSTTEILRRAGYHDLAKVTEDGG